jgi:hypothetical protein
MSLSNDHVCLGGVSLSLQPVAAILNSRQSKRLSLADEWVRSTSAAVKHLVESGYVIATSIGMSTWELLVHLVNVYGGSQLLVIPGRLKKTVSQRAAEIAHDFRLDPARIGYMMSGDAASGKGGRKSAWAHRDDIVIELADILVPVSIRPEGNLGRKIEAASRAGKDLNTPFSVKYRPGAERVSYSLAREDLNPELVNMPWPYLTHWTRSSHLPYPGETRFEYYRDILSHSHFPRSAPDTLRRIVTERKIRASRRFIRGGHKVVSFTGLHPCSAVSLMRWRRRYVYYNFEPYGIAISTEAAENLGIRQVTYGTPELYDTLPASDRPFYQNVGGPTADWKPESEWRHPGDLALGDIPDDRIHLLVYSKTDAQDLGRISPYRVIPLTSY